MSEIRSLLARAQQAERTGDTPRAVALLQEAAAWYRDRQLLKKAAQMLRHVRRVQGLEEEPDGVFGFGSDFEGDAVPEQTFEPPQQVLVEQREARLADPSVDAWCSFCCRPTQEVGPLVAGPAGAFICEGCTRRSLSLRGAAPVEAQVALSSLAFELPAQRRARERFLRLRPRWALLVGPSGSGKSAWAKTVEAAGVELIEVGGRPLDAELARWAAAPQMTWLSVTGAPPPPAFELQGEHGPEPIHDTATLIATYPHLPAAFLSRLDAVYVFEAPTRSELTALGAALLGERGVTLPDEALGRLVELAITSGRGAHELAQLIRRILPGRY